MRPVMHGDVVAAARVLRALPQPARAGAMAGILADAEAGDRYRKRFGRAHLRYGNGSVMSAAARFSKPAEPGLEDVEYLDCLYHVIVALIARRCEKTALPRDSAPCHAYLCGQDAHGGPGNGRKEASAGGCRFGLATDP